MKQIIIVEDDAFIRDELAIMLKNTGYHVDKIIKFSDITSQILRYKPDLILLDINLPNKSGFLICEEIKRTMSIPVLVLTSRDHLTDELRALSIGADEFLTKPFRKARLLARIANVLKRYEGRANMLEKDGFLLDRNTYTLYINDDSVVLPQNQGKLLETFLVSASDVVTKDELCVALWGSGEYIDKNALQVNMTRLKKIMQDIGMRYQIKSIRGVGYALIKMGKLNET